jgi:hypothetical protein
VHTVAKAGIFIFTWRILTFHARLLCRGCMQNRAAARPPRCVPHRAAATVPFLLQPCAPPDLVLPWGYPLESYPVETADGAVLRIYRIPYGVRNASRPGPRPAVLLHHGITLASSCFVVLDPESSMAFYLADAGERQ